MLEIVEGAFVVLGDVQPGPVCDLIPESLKRLLQLVVVLIQIGVPVILVVLGMVDLGKAVMQQKEDDIKEAQQMFVKRLIAAALVFFIIVIIGFFISVIDLVLGDASAGILVCLEDIFPTWF